MAPVLASRIDERFRTDAQEFRRTSRPIRPGYSLGAAGRVGTLGLVVRKRGKGMPLLLSSSHALNRRPDGRVYDVFQPGGRDRSRGANPVARTICYVRASRSSPNRTEGALAAPLDPHVVSATHPLGPIRGVCPRLHVGQELVKVGRTTGLVTGRIVQLDWSGRVRFNGYSAPFDRQLVIEGESGPVSLDGDSGSVWLTKDGDAAALNFASLRRGTLSVSTPIRDVLDRLGVELYPAT